MARWRRSRGLPSALAALLACWLLLLWLKDHYQLQHRLHRLLPIEKHTDELLKYLEVLDENLRLRLERLQRLPRP